MIGLFYNPTKLFAGHTLKVVGVILYLFLALNSEAQGALNPSSQSSSGVDYDGDGINNTQDVCARGNDNRDFDQDGVPDACDLDIDNDGILDTIECAKITKQSVYHTYDPNNTADGDKLALYKEVNDSTGHGWVSPSVPAISSSTILIDTNQTNNLAYDDGVWFVLATVNGVRNLYGAGTVGSNNASTVLNFTLLGAANVPVSVDNLAYDDGIFYHARVVTDGSVHIFSASDPVGSGWTDLGETSLTEQQVRGLSVDNGVYYALETTSDDSYTQKLYMSANPLTTSAWADVTPTTMTRDWRWKRGDWVQQTPPVAEGMGYLWKADSSGEYNWSYELVPENVARYNYEWSKEWYDRDIGLALGHNVKNYAMGSLDLRNEATECNPDGDNSLNFQDRDSDNDGISDLRESYGSNSTTAAAVDADNDGVYDDKTAGAGVSGVANAANGGNGVPPNNALTDSSYDFLNLDSDNDGIPDAIEAQSTEGYISVTETVSLTDTYGLAGGLFVPIDTDADGVADYLDLDSDNDQLSDDTETLTSISWDINNTDGAMSPKLLTNTFGYDGEVDFREVPLTITITSPSNGAVVEGTVTIQGECTSGNTVVVTISPTGAVISPEALSCSAGGTYSVSANTTGLADGTAVITSTLQHRNGYTASVTATIEVDNIHDRDLDGVTDNLDQCNGGDDAVDFDGDGVADFCDLDDDNDGILDSREICAVPFYPTIPANGSLRGSFETKYDVQGEVEVTAGDGTFSSGRPVFQQNNFHMDTVTGGGNTGTVVTYNFAVPVATESKFSISNVGHFEETKIEGITADGSKVEAVVVSQSNANVIFTGTAITVAGIEEASNQAKVEFRFSEPVVTVRYEILGTNDYVVYGITHLCTTIDTDGDGHPDLRDLDSDNDGISDLKESYGLFIAETDTVDENNDGIHDATTLSSDNLGVIATANNGNGVVPPDSDNDGVMNTVDLDSDNDGIPDTIEAQKTTDYINVTENSVNGKGISNNGAGLFKPEDTDKDNQPDYLDLDSDNDNQTDAEERGATVTMTSVTYQATDGGFTPISSLTNAQNTNALEVDYREIAAAINIATDTVSSTMSVTGSCRSDSSTITIRVTGASPETATTTCTGGEFSAGVFEISDLPDGSVTVTATIKDSYSSTATDATQLRVDNPELVTITNTESLTNTAVITGACSPNGGTVTVSVADATPVSKTASCVNGEYTAGEFDVSSLPDGTVSVTSSITDPAGHTASTTTALTVDNPEAVTISNTESLTSTADITGTCSPNSGTVTVSIAGATPVSKTARCVNGEYTAGEFDVSELPDGTVSVTSSITDPVGHTASATTALTIDNPETVTISNTESLTNTADITGICSPNGATVTVSIAGATPVSKTASCVNGEYAAGEFDVSSLPDGTVSVTSSITDPAGHTASATTALTIDNPETVTISNTESLTSTADITGICSPNGGTVTVSVAGATPASKTASCVNGEYAAGEFDVSSLPDGTVSVTSSITDPAGHTASTTTALTIDNPETVTISNTESLTSTADITGTCSPNGGTVTVSIAGATPVSKTASCENGEYTAGEFDVSSLPDGAVSVTSSITDPAGHTASTTTALTIDNPETVTISNTESLTSTADITGICSPNGGTVTVSIAGATPASKTASCENGEYEAGEFDVSSLPDGTVSVTSSITDPAGHTASTTTALTIDNPETVTISNTEPLTSTADITGICSPNGGTVTVSIAGATPASKTASCVNGEYAAGEFDVSSLPDGTVSVTSSITDPAGHTASTTTALTVDNPEAVTISNTESLTSIADITGICSPNGGTVIVSIAGATPVSKTARCENGEYTAGEFDVSSLPDGTVSVTSSITDPAGHTASMTKALTIDNPEAVTISNTESLTSTADITGICSPNGATVTVSIAGAIPTSKTASCVNGEYAAGEFDVSSLPDGTVSVTSSIADPAGHTASTTKALTVDNPETVTISNTESLTSTADIIGACSPNGATVTVSIAGAIPTSKTASCENGEYAAGEFDVSSLPDGTVSVTSSITDPAGHTASTTTALTIDNPETVTISNTESLTSTADITGTCSPNGGTVTVSIAGATPVSKTASCENGEYAAGEFDVSSLPDGTVSVTSSITDPEGHSASMTKVLMIDNPMSLTLTGGEETIEVSLAETLEGGCQPSGATIAMTVIDKVGISVLTKTVTCGSDKIYRLLLDLTSESDRTYTLTVSLQTLAGESTTITQQVVNDRPQSITISTVGNNPESITVTGDCLQNGDTVSLTTNGTTETKTTSCTAGSYSFALTDLRDDIETLEFTSTITDGIGNTSQAYTEIISVPVLTVSVTTETMRWNATVQGSCAPNSAQITVSVTGVGANTATCENGSYTAGEFIVTGLPDSSLTVTVTIANAQNKVASVTTTVSVHNPPDADNDYVEDSKDTCNGGDDLLDFDSDGVPDHCDIDADNDGILNDDEGKSCDSFTFRLSDIEQVSGTASTETIQVPELQGASYVSAGDQFLFGHGLVGGEAYFDVLLKVIRVSATNVAGLYPKGVFTYGKNIDKTPWIEYQLTVVEADSVSTKRPNGIPIHVEDFTLYISDLDSRIGSDTGDFVGFKTGEAKRVTLSPNTVVNFNPESELNLPGGYQYAIASPALLGDPNNWIDEVDIYDEDQLQASKLVAAVKFEFDTFRSVNLIHGNKNSRYSWEVRKGGIFSSGTACAFLDSDNDNLQNWKDVDSDNDGISDILEAIENAALLSQLDSDANGMIDPQSFEDSNANGLDDRLENLYGDGKGIVLTDADNDRKFGPYDLDSDGDGIPDAIEAQPTAGYVSVDETLANAESFGIPGVLILPVDTDNDGIADFRDTDSDNDLRADAGEVGLVIIPSLLSTDGGVNDPANQLANEVGDTAEVGYREIGTFNIHTAVIAGNATITGACAPSGSTVSISVEGFAVQSVPCVDDAYETDEYEFSDKPEGDLAVVATISTTANSAISTLESQITIDRPDSITITNESTDFLSGSSATVTGTCSLESATVSVGVWGVWPYREVICTDGKFTAGPFDVTELDEDYVSVSAEFVDAEGDLIKTIKKLPVNDSETITINTNKPVKHWGGISGVCNHSPNAISVLIPGYSAPLTTTCNSNYYGVYGIDLRKVPTDTFTVTSIIEDTWGNTTSVTETLVKYKPPTVSITQVESSLTTATITGTCQVHGSNIAIAIAGMTATQTVNCQNNSFVSELFDINELPYGTHAVTAILTDGYGSIVSDNNVIEKQLAQTISITSVQANDSLNLSDKAILGSCEPKGQSVTVTVKWPDNSQVSESSECSESGTYSVSFDLSQKPNSTVQITSEICNNGNCVTDTVTATHSAPVSVGIATPTQGQVIKAATSTITGECSPVGASVSVTVDSVAGNDAPLTETTSCNSSRTYSVDVNTAELPDGTANITVQTVDQLGNVGTESSTILIQYKPTAENDGVAVAAGQTASVSILDNDTLANGQSASLSNVLILLVDPVTGMTTSATQVVVAEEGQWQLQTDVITFVPLPTFLGDPAPVNYRIVNIANGSTDEATVLVNYPAVAIDDMLENIIVGQSATVSVLDNDISDEGITYTRLSNILRESGTVDIALIDPSTNAVAVDGIVAIPNQGTYTLTEASGTVTFMPVAGFTGSPTPIQYQIFDGRTTATATVDINYAITAPAAVNDRSEDQNVGATVTVSILDNDALGDASTATASDVNVDIDPDIAGVQNIYNKTGEGKWEYLPASGQLIFIPEADFTNDPSSLTYTLIDRDNNATATATVAIDYQQIFAENDQVTVNGANALTGVQNAVNVLENDLFDEQTATTTNVGINTASTTVTGPNSRVVTVQESGNITIASSATSGVYNVVYYICQKDNQTYCRSATVTINVEQPAIVAVNDNGIVEGADALSGKTSVISNVLVNDLIAGDSVTTANVSIETASTVVTNAAAEVVNALTLNANGSVDMVEQTPAGTYTLSYTVCDKVNPTNCDTATVTVVVASPEIIAIDDSATVNGSDALSGKTLVISNVLVNDQIAGVSVTTTNVSIETASAVVTNAAGEVVNALTLNADGRVDLSENTAAGNYTLSYVICDKLNPTNCDTAAVTVVVASPEIIAVDDSATVNGSDALSGKTSVISNVLVNDQIAGVSVTTANVSIETASTVVANAEGEIVNALTLNADGSVDLEERTAAGTYTLSYVLCDKVNPTNCDTAAVTVVVASPEIIAVDDSATVDGADALSGKTSVISNVLVNDQIAGVSVSATNVSIETASTVVTNATGEIVNALTLNTDGSVDLAERTPAGTYTLSYVICDKVNPTSCDTSTVTVVVASPEIIAVDDSATVDGADALSGKTSVISNVLVNDQIAGVSASATNVSIETASTVVTNAAGEIVNVLTLNADGSVDLSEKTPAGTYTLSYVICDKVNPTNCDTAVVTVEVGQQEVAAENDSVTVSDGDVLSGKSDIIENILSNDEFGDSNASSANVTIKTEATEVRDDAGNVVYGVLSLDADGSIDLSANANAGIYTLTYQICDQINPNNCDTAVVTVQIDAPEIVAADDSVTVSVESLPRGANGIIGNVLSNDGLGSEIATIANVILETHSSVVTNAAGDIVDDVILLNSYGRVDLLPNAPAGTYSLTYRICDYINQSSCDTAVVTVVVPMPEITAANDSAAINGSDALSGKTSVISNVLVNDQIAGVSASATNVSIETASTVVTNAAGEVVNALTLNANGSVDLAERTPAGTYTLSYVICDEINSTNCDTAVVTVVVASPEIIAIDDSATVNGSDAISGKASVISNILANDLIAGDSVTTTNVSIETASTVVTNATGEGVNALTLNADGSVDLSENAAAGTYTLSYVICDEVNPTNCDTGVVTVEVGQQEVAAENDSVTVSDGDVLSGKSDIIENILSNDEFGDSNASSANVTIKIEATEVRDDAGNVVYGVLSLDADGSIDLSANANAGIYTLTYQICDQINPNNCDTAVVTVQIDAPEIVAADDSVTVSVESLPRGANGIIGNVLSNDGLGSEIATIANVILETYSSAVTNVAGDIVDDVILLNSYGRVDLLPNAPAGTYSLTYRICDYINQSSCDTAVVTVVVPMPEITAANDSAAINGSDALSGKTSVISNVLVNDQIAGVSASATNVSIETASTVVTNAAGEVVNALTLNANGSVDLAERTPAGTYTLSYVICDEINSTNCDTAVVTVVVASPEIIAIDDSATVNGSDAISGKASVISNILANDLIAGDSVTTTNVSIETASTVVTNATGEGVNALTLNADGSVDLSENAAAGTYTLSYVICDEVNPTNCDTGVVTVEVGQQEVAAENDSVTVSDGDVLSGKSDIIENILSNDEFGDSNASSANVTIKIEATEVRDDAGNVVYGVLSLDADGSIDLSANANAGIYTLTYQICDQINPNNCDTAVVTVQIDAPEIVAADDSVTVSVESLPRGANGIIGNVLSNDGLGSEIATIANVILETHSSVVTNAAGEIVDDVILLNSYGRVDLLPNTPAGTYSLIYRICDYINQSSCDTAVVTVAVPMPEIAAANDSATVDGADALSGKTSVISNVLVNDQIAGVSASATNVSIETASTAVTNAAGEVVHALTLNTHGSVDLVEQTPAGTYTLSYTICDKINPTNCDTAVVTVEVGQQEVVAEDDSVTVSDGDVLSGKSDIIENILSNDEFGDSNASSANVTIKTEATEVRDDAGDVVYGVLSLDADGSIDLSANANAGNYTLTYQICDQINPNNCDTAVVTVQIDAPEIVAADDSVTVSVESLPRGANGIIGNVLSNDGLGSEIATIANVILETHSSVVTNAAGDIVDDVILLNSYGRVDLLPNAQAGAYSLTYRICDYINQSSCDTAVVTVIVPIVEIEAIADIVTLVAGSNSDLSVLDNDLLNGQAVSVASVAIQPTPSITNANGELVSEISLTDSGIVAVEQGVPAGTYAIEYEICESINTTNCNTATVTVEVTAPELIAADDSTVVNGADALSGKASVISNVLDNDLIADDSATTANVSIVTAGTVVINASGDGVEGVLILNADGSVDLAEQTPAGTYTLSYMVCDIVNPTNCATATITVGVLTAAIDAVADSMTIPAGSNSDGSVLANDLLNGQVVSTSVVTIQRTSTVTNSDGDIVSGVTLLDSGMVAVEQGVAAESYTIEYEICDAINPNNCDTAIAQITVPAPAINAVPESMTIPADANSGESVLANDLLNGQVVSTSTVTIQPTYSVTDSDGEEVSGITVLDNGVVAVEEGVTAGSYTIEYEICDNINSSNCDTAIVQITVPVPAINAVSDSMTISAGTRSDESVLANDLLNGQSVSTSTVTIQGSPTITNNESGEVVDGIGLAENGVIAVSEAVPAGNYIVEYVICENINLTNCSTTEAVVTIPMPVVVANDDIVEPINLSDAESDDLSNIVNVLLNDEINGDTATTDNISIVSAVATVTSLTRLTSLTRTDDTEIEVDVISLNSDGSVDISADITVGTYTLTYNICDVINTTQCSSAELVIVVVSDTEQSQSQQSSLNLVDDRASVTSGTPITIAIFDNDSDIPTTASLTITQPTNGTAVLDDAGVPDSIADDVVVYESTQEYVGTDSMSYQVCLEAIDCYTATISIDVIRHPIIKGTEVVTLAGENVSLKVEQSPASKADVLTLTVSQPTFGTVTLTGDSENPILDVRVPENITGIITFTVTSCNQENRCESAVYTVTVLPGPALTDDDVNVVTNQSTTISFLDNDDKLPEGSVVSVFEPSHGTVDRDDPNNTVDNPLDDIFIYTPDEGYTGSDSFTYQVCNKSNKCSTATVSIKVEDPMVNPAVELPEATARVVLSKTVDESQVFVGDVISYSLEISNPSDMSASVRIIDKPANGIEIMPESLKIKGSEQVLTLIRLGAEELQISGVDREITIESKATVVIEYQALISTGAAVGDLNNTAVVKVADTEISNVSTASVLMIENPVFGLASITGKVYNDVNHNQNQEPEEAGVPGIRLATVTGEVIITDRHGRFTIPNVNSGVTGSGDNYILKLDESSLPACAKITSENPRVIRLTRGLISRVDFTLDLGDSSVDGSNEITGSDQVELIDTIYFKNAEDAIDAEKLTQIEQKLSAYKGDKGIRIQISGHTDNDPLRSEEYKTRYGDNYGLAQHRAQAVGRQLVSKLRLPKNQVEYVGYGPDKPIASNATEAGQAKNRRVEISIIKPSSQAAKPQTTVSEDCQQQEQSRVQVINRDTTGQVARTKIAKITLTDAFFEEGSVLAKDISRLPDIIRVLEKNGGKIEIQSDNPALRIARAAMLRKLLPKWIEISP